MQQKRTKYDDRSAIYNYNGNTDYLSKNKKKNYLAVFKYSNSFCSFYYIQRIRIILLH